MKISLNFLAPPPSRRLPWLLLGLGAVAIWLGADTLFKVQEEHAQLLQELHQQTETHRSLSKPPLPSKALVESNALAESIAAEIRYPWAQTLREVEAAYGEGVLLKVFEHNQAKATTHLELQANTSARFLEVTRRLEDASGEEYVWRVGALVRNDQGYRLVLNGKPR